MKYAYVVALVGVVLATITTAYTAARSFMFSQALRSRPFINPGNFTGARQFGNFTGGNFPARQFVTVNPLGGLVTDLTIIAVIIAILGLAWLGFALMKPSKTATERAKSQS